jgi:GntR family transcriptional regulator, vanillate catabolism transcriptional regulator
MVTDTDAIQKLSLSRTRLVDEVAKSLRGLILRGEIAPGTHLLQVDLAEMLGVSRTPLREAFRLLEQDGLVRVANGNRTVEVIDPDPSELIELHEVREVIDGLAAFLCAERDLTKGELASLQDPIKKMERLSGQRSTKGAQNYVDNHAEFHTNMVRCAGNERLRDMIPLVQMSAQMGMSRYVRTHRPELIDDLEAAIPEMVARDNADHAAILEAIVDNDAKRAEALAREHVRHLSDNIKRFAAA